ncbi:nuclear GTP-binding protein nug1 [Dispira simplex]|nr:nuclear GTP-binding protein nug1 [Dispira simplex]
MVPKKHKSKRKSTQLTVKISRKAREKRRKARKKAKANPNRGKLKKDPGILSLWSFKEMLLNQIEESRIRAEDEKKRQKQQRAQLHTRNRNIKDITSVAELVQNSEAQCGLWIPGTGNGRIRIT